MDCSGFAPRYWVTLYQPDEVFGGSGLRVNLTDFWENRVFGPHRQVGKYRFQLLSSHLLRPDEPI